jgi:uncharacterized lipoprotein YbaY
VICDDVVVVAESGGPWWIGGLIAVHAGARDLIPAGETGRLLAAVVHRSRRGDRQAGPQTERRSAERRLDRLQDTAPLMPFPLRSAACTVAVASSFTLLASAVMAGTLTGTATYRERIALPPEAVFEVLIEDIARADAPATVIGRQRLAPAGLPPFRFAIPYDDSAVSPRGRYTLRATARHRGELLFTTDTVTPVLDGRPGPVKLLLVKVGAGKPDRSRPVPTGLGPLPASWRGDIPDAGGTSRWHVDLAPDRTYQLRQTYLGRPAPNRFDDIGRWRFEPGTDRLVLRGGHDPPLRHGAAAARQPAGADHHQAFGRVGAATASHAGGGKVHQRPAWQGLSTVPHERSFRARECGGAITGHHLASDRSAGRHRPQPAHPAAAASCGTGFRRTGEQGRRIRWLQPAARQLPARC